MVESGMASRPCKPGARAARIDVSGADSGRGLASAPDGAADEEGPEAIEIERRLLRLPHHLYDRGERKQILADEADDEVVVVAVEAVAGQADVVRVVGGAESHADRPVLRQDGA